MNSLHSITIKSLERWAWLHIVGGRGRDIGLVGGERTAHLFRVTRETPEAIPQPENRHQYSYGRTYWRPWQPAPFHVPPHRRLLPICNSVRSKSREPALETAIQNRWIHHCQACVAEINNIGGTGNYIEQLDQEDPWSQIPYGERRWATDPVTGT